MLLWKWIEYTEARLFGQRTALSRLAALRAWTKDPERCMVLSYDYQRGKGEVWWQCSRRSKHMILGRRVCAQHLDMIERDRAFVDEDPNALLDQ